MEFHEVASIFPMMSKDEFEALKTDIAQNGLLEPIWTHQDKIIDGRNRYNACMEVGIIPEYREWHGQGSLIAFVVSLNLKRRHLNETQRGIIASKLANMSQGERTDLVSIDTKLSLSDAAEMMNIGRATVARIKSVERDAPELIEKMESGQMSAHEASKKAKEKIRKQERGSLAEKAKELPVSSRWNVSVLDILGVDENRIGKYDFIITDPPYPREYIELYKRLENISCAYLKPGGLLIAMCGQSYFDEIVKSMGEYLDYYWTAAYLTPGQPTPLRQRQVNTTWKPLLIYSKGNYTGKIFGDVFKSDGNDKDFHKWGQSISGMLSIISQICLPGQYIYDPFCGAGTTGIAALMHGCLFDGSDIDEQNVNISRYRLAEVEA